PYREIPPGPPSAQSVLRLLEIARRLASVVLLDLPCTFDDVLFEALSRADHVVLVGVQTVASMRAMKLIRDVLVREEGLRPPTLVVNRYDPAVPGFEAGRLAELLRDPDLMTVAADFPSLMAAAEHARPLRDAAEWSPILPDVRRLAGRVAGGPARPAGDPSESQTRPKAGPRPLRVLHIEDDPVQLYVVQMHLARQAGYRCAITPATSEEEGVGRFKAEPFDLVVLDYHLAEGDGLSTLRRLRAADGMVPILVVSGLTEPHVAAELLEAGADDFLSKENLAGERLGRALAAALARSDALRARLPRPEEAAQPAGDALEMLGLVDEVRRSARGGSFGAARLQRLADLVGDELDKGGETPFPRKGLLSLFLRLFAGEQPGA
ncbi:MAG: response regulator, partial [Gemmataceae bacterium]